ncbi:MAG: PAS domain S-box protein [Bacteroidetes bacterium]|nr:PAS domain S-box protein [Bacteroidota bacterium]
MFSDFEEKIKNKGLSNLRSLSVFTAMIVTALGFVFEITYLDIYILWSGLGVSMLFTSNYYFSYRSRFYKTHFTNITYASVFVLHFWEVYVAYMRGFELAFLPPVALSIFIFSLVFGKFSKSLVFIFTVTTFMLVMMITTHHWQTNYVIAIATLYSGALLAYFILQRKNEYHLEIYNRDKKYIALVENMNSGLIYIDQDNHFIFVNDKFCKITGFSSDEILGKNILDFFITENKDTPAVKFFQELSDGIRARHECEMVRKNNDAIWVQMSGSPFYNDNGKRNGSMVVFADITDLKVTQERLKKREEGYRTFIDQSAVGIWRAEYKPPIPVNLPVQKQVDLLLNTGYISECNEFMAQMYGYHRSSELIGRRIKDFYYVENNFDEEKTNEFLSSYVKNSYRISNAESKELDKDGNIRYILNNNIGIIEEGCLVRTWGVQTDITDRKRTERELSETNQELDTFFYKASHDLKGPLASVMGIVNLARLENQDQLIEKYFGMVESSVKRLDETLLDLIELARTRKGTSKLSVINVKGLVDEILNSLRHVSNFGKINFEIKVDTAIEITSDKVLMLSVFQNLIHNAINYCNQQSPWIKITVKETEQGIDLEIADNGKGIAEGVKSKVFEMFYRGHPDSSGSGLGLFIVKNALEKMHGKIHFDSESGKGTVFYVSIPNALVEA